MNTKPYLLMLKEERKGLISKMRPTFIRNLTPQRDSHTSIKNLTLQGQKWQRKENYLSSYLCYHCDKMGDISKNCPARRKEYKKRNNKRHHAHAVEDDDPPTKLTKEEIEDCVLFFALSGSMTLGEDTWLIDSGASKHMTGQRDILSSLTEKYFTQKVSLVNDYQYPIKGMGESTYKLDSGTSPIRMNNVS
jgi:hypothetical protein